MFLWVSCFLLMINLASAEVGKISKVAGQNNGHILRHHSKIPLTEEMLLEEGDEVTTNESVVVLQLLPTTQMSLSKNTQIKLSKNALEEAGSLEKSTSVIDFIKGIIRLQVVRDPSLEIDQKVEADGVAFAVRGTEFEVSKSGENVDLDVVEGEVEVSSPFVQTFVPEIVKANEGFRFNKKARNFARRKFKERLKNQPGLMNKDEIKARWLEKRKQKKVGRKLNKKVRRQRKSVKK